MRYILIASLCFVMLGCCSKQPIAMEQLILDVPADLLSTPPVINTL